MSTKQETKNEKIKKGPKELEKKLKKRARIVKKLDKIQKLLGDLYKEM